MHRNDRLMLVLIAMMQLMTWWWLVQLQRLIESMPK